MDFRSQKNLDTLHDSVKQPFLRFISECQVLAGETGLEYKVICGTRTYEQQSELYELGRSKAGKIITNARPGYSFHNFGLAVDCGVFQDGVYLDEKKPKVAEDFHRKASAIARKHGIRWGGDFKNFKDFPHFEWDSKLTLAELRDRKAKKLPVA